MNNLIYDESLCFGSMAAIASGTFSDVLNLGKKPGSTDSYPGKEFTSVDRRTADVIFNKPAGGTSVTVIVEGSKTGTSAWGTLGSAIFTLEQMKKGPCQIPFNNGEYQYLRVSITSVNGSFTSDGAKAYLNTYAGK